MTAKTKADNKKTGGSRMGMFKLLKPYKKMIALLIVFTLAGNAANLEIPKIISHGIDA
ncbi:MAG: hypothetical protein ACK5M7_20260 [Draconibacterium sp.]